METVERKPMPFRECNKPTSVEKLADLSRYSLSFPITTVIDSKTETNGSLNDQSFSFLENNKIYEEAQPAAADHIINSLFFPEPNIKSTNGEPKNEEEQEKSHPTKYTQSFPTLNANKRRTTEEYLSNPQSLLFPSKALENNNTTAIEEQIKVDAQSHKGMKLKSYSIEFKLEVVAFAEEKSLHAAERLYKVDRKSIRSWKNNKHRLVELSASSAKGFDRKRLNGGGRKVFDRQLEKRLLDWIYCSVERDEKVGGSMIIAQAQEFQKQRINSAGHVDSKKNTLNFSRGWLEKFVLRNNLAAFINGGGSVANGKQALSNPPEVVVVEPSRPQIHCTHELTTGHHPISGSSEIMVQNVNDLSMVSTHVVHESVKPSLQYNLSLNKHNSEPGNDFKRKLIVEKLVAPVEQPPVYILDE